MSEGFGVQLPSLELTGYVVLGKLLNHSEPQFFQILNKNF